MSFLTCIIRANNTHDPQRIVTNSGDEISKLIDTQKQLKAAMADLRSRMVRLDRATQREDETIWCQIEKDNANVQEDSQRGALKLSAAIDMYISLHGDVSEEDVDEVIIELDNLRTSLAGYELDYHGAMETLVSRTQELSKQQQEAVQARSELIRNELEAAAAEVKSYRDELAQHAGRGGESPTRDATSNSSYQVPRLSTLSLLVYSLFSSSRKKQAQGQLGVPIGTPGRILASCKSANSGTSGGNDAAAQNKLLEAHDRYDKAQSLMKSLERAYPSELADSVHSVVKYLQTQGKHMKALPALRTQLLNEINAYQKAFEGLKAYPTSERKAALEAMHQRVTATALAWRGVSTLLTDGYARGE